MLTVRDIMTKTPLVLPCDANLVDAARLMRTNNVGDVLITDHDGHLHGVITDRDIVVRPIANGHPLSAQVGDHATTACGHSVAVALDAVGERAWPVGGGAREA